MAVLLVARLAYRVATFLPARLRNAAADVILAFLPARLIARLAYLALDRLVAGLVAGLVASLAFLAIAGLAYLLHDRLLNGLVAGVPALLEYGIVHQLVAGAALLLAGAEAALGIATRIATAGVLVGAAVGCSRRPDCPEKADHRDQQRHSQAHPHDLASSIGR
jgi:hypothetical protein